MARYASAIERSRQPILHTDRLLLVPLEDRHLELEVELDSGPDVMRYLSGGRIARRAAGEFVGLMMLPPAHGPDQPDDPTVADLGYRFLRRCWRRGLASDASLVLLRHAFETVGIRRVIAQTMAVNAASRGAMTAVGMSYLRTYFPIFDEPLPRAEEGEVEYELTAAAWVTSLRPGETRFSPPRTSRRRGIKSSSGSSRRPSPSAPSGRRA